VKRLSTRDAGFRKEFDNLARRDYSVSPEIAASVANIIEQVRVRGDEALDEFCRKFDGRPQGMIEVGKDRMEEAAHKLDGRLMNAIKYCAERVRKQAERELPRRIPEVTDEIGITLGRRLLPLRRAGLYVPGGRAAYPSSLIMAAVPASVAGVRELIVASPLDPASHESQAVLAAAHVTNIDRFFVAGGAHAVAALAFGTARVPKVDIIVGPGNAYVAEAKRQLYGVVNIDGVAGPSELVVIADDTMPPSLAAADLMAQAEHGPDSRCALMADDPQYADAVEGEIERLTAQSPRMDIIRRSLGDYGIVVIVKDLDEAAELANEYAPEHLELACAGADRLLAKIRNAGAIFLGIDTPEVLGDYLAGSNHVLPTAGTARFLSPLSAMTFIRSTNIIRASREGMKKLADPTITLAQSEGLHAHMLSIVLRTALADEE
jgi:histidinol dehydrogenase